MIIVINYSDHCRTSILGIETRWVISYILWDLSLWVGMTSKSKKFLGVFTDPGFDVVAGNIMPHNTVIVEVVEDGNAGLISAGLAEFTVVGLGSSAATSARPSTSPSLGAVGGWDSCRGTGPEPSVDNGRLKIGTVTAIKVALATRGPDVLDISLLDLAVDELGLILGLETYQILTMLSADVPCIKPVPLMRCSWSVLP